MSLDCTGLAFPQLEMCTFLNTPTPEALSCLDSEYLSKVDDVETCIAFSSLEEKITNNFAGSLNSGNTAWMLFATALVMIMTPGVGLFYGGLAGETSVGNTLLMAVACMVIVSFQWFLFGYSFAFGPGTDGFGRFDWFCLTAIGNYPSAVYAIDVPHILFVVFQMMFAIITPALITSAFIGRMKFSAFCIFVFTWTTLIYDPLAHWHWALTLDPADFKTIKGLGWIGAIGAVDFAGGSVIHISSGFSALAAALIIGRRSEAVGQKLTAVKPHNVPMVMLGAAFLWFGWFGFNAGSALAANGLAAHVFINTQLAAATAGLTWIVIEKVIDGAPTAAGLATGIVAGLVGITPACGFVHNYAAFIVGLITALVVFGSMKLKTKMGIDDTLDSWAVHGCGGATGALLTGLFATKDINTVAGGFYYSEPQFGYQLLSVVVSSAFAFFGTLIIMLVLKFTIGVRINEDAEKEGIDMSEHGGKSYQ